MITNYPGLPWTRGGGGRASRDAELLVLKLTGKSR